VNLHGVVSGAIAAINPFISVSIQVSNGYTTNGDGSRSPAYLAAQVVSAQVQALQYTDIMQADAMNIQGTRRKLYINGAINGLVRQTDKGGDLVTLPDGTVWKVAFVAEQWPDWCSAVITQQNGS